MSSDISTYDTVQPSLSRRDLLKTGAATGAAAVGVSASSGSASAQSATSTAATAAKMGMMASPTGFAVVGVYSAIAGLRSSNEDLIARNNLHQSAVAEQQSWDGHLIQFENRLEDSAMVAHIESRDAIARSYESGASSADALTNMNQRVSNWYADAPEHNVIEIANKVLLSLHAIAQDGDKTDPKFTVMGTGQDDSGEGYNFVISPRAEGTVADQTVTLHNGDEHEVGNGVVEADDNAVEDPVTPVLEIWHDDAGNGGYPEGTKVDEFPLLSDKLLDAYNEDGGERSAGSFTFSADDGSRQFTEVDIRFTIPGIADNDDVNPETVFDFGEVAQLLTEISDQSDLVVNQYDQSFVDDLYSEMDAGNLDPNDIRGSAGMAQFLSGTDDASASRFQLALMQQLDLSRSDLSEVASMKADFEGYLDRTIERDNGNREIFFDSMGEESLEGQLFAKSATDTVATGESYDVNPVVFTTSLNGDLSCYDLSTLSRLWRTTPDGSRCRAVTYHRESETLIVVGIDDMYKIDPTTGDILDQTGGTPHDIQLSHDGSTIYTRGGTAVDSSTLSTDWTPDTASFGGVQQVDVTSEAVYWACGGDPSGIVATGHGGNTVWEYDSGSSSSIDFVSAPENANNLFSVDSDGVVRSHSKSDGEEIWSSSFSDRPWGIAAEHDGSAVYVSLIMDTGGVGLAALDSDGASIWEVPMDDHGPVTAHRGMEEIYVGPGSDDNNIHVIDKSDGSAVETKSVSDGSGIAISSGTAHLPLLSNATFYDLPDGEDKSLASGLLTVTEITDADGNEMDESDYSDPEYDSFDSGEYSKYIEEHTTYQETIYKETEGPDWSFPWPSVDPSSWLPDPPLLAIGALVAGYLYFGRDNN